MKSEIQKTKLNYSLRLALVLLTILLVISAAQAGTLVVNSNADSNVCDDVLTLREAMLLGSGGNYLGRPLTTGERSQISGATFASAPPPLNCSFTASYWSVTSGVGGGIADDIIFSTLVSNILLTSGLPNITWAEDVINGLKSDGTKAAIDGTAAGNVPGLRVIATVGFTIRNLIIKNFQYEGILVEGSDNGVYEGLEIRNNGRDGIALVGYNSAIANYNSTNNRIGGTNANQRNFIYSNGHNGISIITTWSAPHYPDQGNVIENNYIGLKDNNGNQDNGNGWDGIYFESAFGNRIGGDTAASRNVISGNDSNGILLLGNGNYSNRIVNNFIGTDKDGNGLIGNNQAGVGIVQGAGYRALSVQPNKIGDVGQGNVIAGNLYGIALYDSITSQNIIRGNFIGTDLGANLNLGNVNNGIYINLAHDNTIGGIGVGNENVIAYNGGSGIYIEGEGAINNAIRRNRIFLNSYLGIDLHPFGVTVNDPGDFDLGPNNLLNFPLIGSGSSGGGFTNLSGAMGSTANTAFTLDFFVSPDRDPSGYGEGSTYIGSTTVTTDNFGFAGYSLSFNTVLNYSGFYATATATDPNGNTSEFSPATRIGCSYSISPSSQNFGAAGGSGSFNLTTTSACDWQAVRSDSWITVTGGASGTGNGTVSFSVAANSGAARTGTITVGGRLFTITQASSCTYQLSHFSAGYPAGGTNFDGLSLTAGSGCPWMATSNANWITITSGSSGSGNGSVTWSVAANTGPARQGTLTVAGITFTINQAAGCTFSLSAAGQNFPVIGGSGSVGVTAGSGCVWTAVSNVAWVTITGSANGNGNGTVSYTVSSNAGVGPARSGTLTIAGLTYTINQTSGCTYSLSHYFAGYPASGTSSDGVSVIAAAGCTWTAVSNAEWITISSGSIGNGNGTVTWSVAANTGPARQGTVTVAGLTFTINQAAAPRRAPFDFDGDGKTDIGIFRPSDGSWWYVRSIDNAFRVFNFGTSTDILTPGDFTGDGKTDIAIFRPSSGFWYIQRSEDNSFFSFPFGTNGDIPVPADYDADGKADAAVFRPSNSTWYILNSGNGTTSIVGFGSNGDKPVVADYDGDGRSDIAIWRPSDGSWWYLQSSNSQFKVYRFGVATDKPVQGDYTGDGKADIAVWRPSTGEWFVQRSEDNSYYSVPFGTVGDVPAPGDYDGDGKFDPTVFRPSDTNWYISRSSGGTTIQPFGNAGDKPIPAAFIP